MNTLSQIFAYENNELEIIVLNDEILFNAKQVGEVLEISDVTVRRYLQDFTDKQKVKITNKMIENSNVLKMNFRKMHNTGENFLTEKGLYRLVFASKKPSALEFQEWVFDEVLPTIRKTGGYIGNKESLLLGLFSNDALTVAQSHKKLVELETKPLMETIEKQNEVIEIQQPKVEYHDNILNAEGTHTITTIAKQFGLSGRKLNEILRDEQVQYKLGGQWLLYARYSKMGYTGARTSYVKDVDRVFTTTLWTEKGRKFIVGLLRRKGYITQWKTEGELKTLD